MPDDATVRRALSAIDPLRAELGLPPGQPLARYAPDFREQLDMLIELRVPVVSFTFGLISAQDVERLHAARQLCDRHRDAYRRRCRVARYRRRCDRCARLRGGRASWHLHPGRFEDALVGTMALVPNLSTPPVCRCWYRRRHHGWARHRGRACAPGAQAAQMGTAFLTCAESAIPADWKTRVRTLPDTATEVTRAITGRHARGIRNPLMQQLSEQPGNVAPYPVQNALTQELRQSAKPRQ